VTLVLDQLVATAVTPLNVTMLDPWVGSNPVPAIVMEVPARPLKGERFVIAGTTEKFAPLLETPATVTATFPVVAAAGTGTTILVELQLVGVAAAPLNVTVLKP
jgi:hypothetical protein